MAEGTKIEWADQKVCSGCKIIDVFICKLRAKLRPHGLEIATIWGRGYELTPDARARLQAWGGG